MPNKFKDFLTAYWELTQKDNRGRYVPIPNLMRELSEKWNASQKEVKDYISDLPFQNGKFYVSKCPSRTKMPKTHTIIQGKGLTANVFYFIIVWVKKKGHNELQLMQLSDLKREDRDHEVS